MRKIGDILETIATMIVGIVALAILGAIAWFSISVAIELIKGILWLLF